MLLVTAVFSSTPIRQMFLQIKVEKVLDLYLRKWEHSPSLTATPKSTWIDFPVDITAQGSLSSYLSTNEFFTCSVSNASQQHMFVCVRNRQIPKCRLKASAVGVSSLWILLLVLPSQRSVNHIKTCHHLENMHPCNLYKICFEPWVMYLCIFNGRM